MLFVWYIFDIKIITEVNVFFKNYSFMINAPHPKYYCVWEIEENFHYRGKDNYHRSIEVVKSSATLPFKT